MSTVQAIQLSQAPQVSGQAREQGNSTHQVAARTLAAQEHASGASPRLAANLTAQPASVQPSDDVPPHVRSAFSSTRGPGLAAQGAIPAAEHRINMPTSDRASPPPIPGVIHPQPLRPALAATTQPLQIVVEQQQQPQTGLLKPVDALPAARNADQEREMRSLLEAEERSTGQPVLRLLERTTSPSISQDGNVAILFPDCSDEEFGLMQATATNISRLSRVIAEPSCLTHPRHTLSRSRVRFLAGSIVGSGPVAHQWAAAANSNTGQWASVLIPLFLLLTLYVLDYKTTSINHTKQTAKKARKEARKSLDGLLQPYNDNMQRNARHLVHSWVRTTINCEDPVKAQRMQYIAENWKHRRQELLQIATDRIGSASKAEELLKPMDLAVEAIELDCENNASREDSRAHEKRENQATNSYYREIKGYRRRKLKDLRKQKGPTPPSQEAGLQSPGTGTSVNYSLTPSPQMNGHHLHSSASVPLLAQAPLDDRKGRDE